MTMAENPDAVEILQPHPSYRQGLHSRSLPLQDQEPDMSERTVRLHRVIRATLRKTLSCLHRGRGLGQVAAAVWLHLHRASSGCHGRRVIPHVLPQFFHRQQPRLRRRISGAGAASPDPLHRPFRRSESARRDRGHGAAGAGACGTALWVERAGIPGAILLEMCYLGWPESLAQFTALVEPDIPG